MQPSPLSSALKVRSRCVFVACALALCSHACATGRARQAESSSITPPGAVKRTLLVQRTLADPPGFESRLYLIEFPPGAEAQLHMHPIQCVGYVLEGSFESAFGDGALTTKREGEGFVDLAHEPHRFRNPDPVRPLRFVIAGTFHHDEPLFLPL